MINIGEVKGCAHCSGTGKCRGGGPACQRCISDVTVNVGVSSYEGLACSGCGGKGSVWIGPNIVQIPSPER